MHRDKSIGVRKHGICLSKQLYAVCNIQLYNFFILYVQCVYVQ